MSARAGSKGRSQSVRLSMVSVSTDDRDSAAPEPPEPRVRGCVVVTKTSGCLVNAFSEHRDAPRVRTRPLCAMLCAMHSLAGGIAAPRSVFRLDGLAVATQESREGTIVAVLADPEADDDALATETRIVARAFAVAARRAVAGVVDADLLAAETGGPDETQTDATLELFAGFHAGYVATNVLGRTASLAKRWLGALAAVEGVRAAHAFLSLAREEAPGVPVDLDLSDDFSDERRRFDESFPLPTVSIEDEDASPRTPAQHTVSPLPDLLAPAARAASREWLALRRRAAAMLDAALLLSRRGDGTFATLTETLAFPSLEHKGTLFVTLRAFASEPCVLEEANGTRKTYRDAACVAAVSFVDPSFAEKTPSLNSPTYTRASSESTSDGLEEAFERARRALLADLAFPSAETHAPPVFFSRSAFEGFDAREEREERRDAYVRPGSPTSPLERASDASSADGSSAEERGFLSAPRVAPPSRSRRGTRVYPYEPSPREGRGSGTKASRAPGAASARR